MKIYKVLISMMIIIGSSATLMAEIVILTDFTALRGTVLPSDDKILNITEIQSGKKITIRRSEIQYIIEENLLDEETLKNYKTIDWPFFDYQKIGEKRKELERQKKVESESFITIYSPRAGIFAGISSATGDVGKAINTGFFGMLFNDYKIPVTSFVPQTELRAGLMAGYFTYTSRVSGFPADLSLIPIIAYGEISYQTEIGLGPYFRIGSGITKTSLTDHSDNIEKQNASSMDGILMIGTGMSYMNEHLPYLEFFINLNYIMITEKVAGNFINASFGTAYHFYTARQ